MCCAQNPTDQRGMALITVLLIVVMVVTLAAIMLAKQDRLVTEAQVFLRGDQAHEFALGAEDFSIQLLLKDAKTNQTDSVKDVWAKPIPTYEVQDGQVSARITEHSGRFNLNNLYHDGAVDEVQVAYFERLLAKVGLDKRLAKAVLDWQDPDGEPSKDGGAEAAFYKSLPTTGVSGVPKLKPLPPNQPFVSVRELGFVHGFDDEGLKKILPLVTALPNFNPININTASPQVLAALGDKVDAKAVAEFAKAQAGRAPIDSVAAFLKLPMMSNLTNPDKLTYMLSVDSRYFTSDAVVTLSDRKRYLRSHLIKHNGVVSVFARDTSPFVLSADYATSTPSGNDLNSNISGSSTPKQP